MIKIYENGIDDASVFLRKTDAFSVEKIVSEIIDNVIKNGDKAVKEYTIKFDKLDRDNYLLSLKEIEKIVSTVSPKLISVMSEAIENIKAFHVMQKRSGFEIEKDGAILGQIITPIERAGIYVPGGKAAYPSSVIMNVVPAKLAGVNEIVMVTPASGGVINPNVIAAAKLSGVDKIFLIGGAQAVAALAYGTETIPKCDKIVGPGNAFVAEAKKQVFGVVGIDMIAGPSEILIVADKQSRADFIAADLLSQAEHDENASAVLVTDSLKLAKEVALEVDKQLKTLEKEKIASASIENNGKIIVCKNIDDAITVANRLAPEHLELQVENPFEMLKKVKNAGSVFLGRYTPEPVGDYFAGTNHVLPTMGTAKFSSALGVDDFIKKTQYVYYDKAKILADADKIELFAETEGLTAHQRSVKIRKKYE